MIPVLITLLGLVMTKRHLDCAIFHRTVENYEIKYMMQTPQEFGHYHD